MCIYSPEKVDSPVLVGFKVMVRSEDGYKCLFRQPRNVDNRVYKVGEKYEASTMHGFHAIPLLNSMQLFCQELFTDMDKLLSDWDITSDHFSNHVLVCVELSGNLFRESAESAISGYYVPYCLQDQISGDFQKILFEVK